MVIQSTTVICLSCDSNVSRCKDVQCSSQNDPADLAESDIGRMGGVNDAQDGGGVGDKKLDVLACEGPGPYQMRVEE